MRLPQVYRALKALPKSRRRLDTVYGPVDGDVPRCVFGELCPSTRGEEGAVSSLSYWKGAVRQDLGRLGLDVTTASLLQRANDGFPHWKDVSKYKSEEEVQRARYEMLLDYAGAP